MAYYFPQAIDIEIQKERREGSYSDISSSGSTDVYARWYLNIGINHGSGEVSDGQYLYVTLPGMSVEEIEAYAANNTLQIVDGSVDEGNTNAHFIKNNNGTMMAVNYYGKGTYKADWLTLDSGEGGCVSIIVTEDIGTYTLSIADPNYSNAKLSIASDYKMNVVSKSEEITVADDNMSFTVDTTDAGGHSFQITFTLEGKEPTIVWPTAEKISSGKTLADIQLTGGSTKGSFAWAKPETVPEVGTNSYTLVYTSTEGVTYTREITVTVVEISGSDEEGTGDTGSSSDEGDTEDTGSGSDEEGTGNTGSSSDEGDTEDTGSDSDEEDTEDIGSGSDEEGTGDAGSGSDEEDTEDIGSGSDEEGTGDAGSGSDEEGTGDTGSSSDEEDTEGTESGSDEEGTGTTGSGSADTGNTDTGSTESGSTGSGSTHSTNSATDVTDTVQSSITNETVNSPQTGDTSRVVVMTVSMLLGIMCILVLVLHKKVN